MPTATRDGRELDYRVRETDVPPDSDEAVHEPCGAVVLVPDACVGPWSWAWTLEQLGVGVRAVVYRPAPPGPEGGVAALAADLEAVLAAAGVRRAHLVGAGLGGQVALQHAHDHGRARSLLLLGTGVAGPDPETTAALCDTDPVASLRPYLGAHLDTLDPGVIRRWRAEDDPDRTGRERQLAAARGFEAPPLHEVGLPARVRHGGADAVWAVEAGRALAAALPRGAFEVVRETPHLLPVAAPALVADEAVALVAATTGHGGVDGA